MTEKLRGLDSGLRRDLKHYRFGHGEANHFQDYVSHFHV